MHRLFLLLICFSIQSFASSKILIIGIAGGTGSGKTTLADKILHAFPDDHARSFCRAKQKACTYYYP